MTTCAEWRTKLAEAIAAQHDLMLGNKVTTIKRGEKQIDYSAANRDDLREYVAELQRRVDKCDGVSTAGRRIIRFVDVDER